MQEYLISQIWTENKWIWGTWFSELWKSRNSLKLFMPSLEITKMRAFSSPHVEVYTAVNRWKQMWNTWQNCKITTPAVRTLRGSTWWCWPRWSWSHICKSSWRMHRADFKDRTQRGCHYSSFLGMARRLHNSCMLLLWESIFGMIEKLS